MKMLKKTLLNKEAYLIELKNCLSLFSDKYNSTDIGDQGLNVRPIVRLLNELKELSKLEKYIYGSIRRKLDTYYPPDIPLDGSGDSTEMLQSLQSIFRHIGTTEEDISQPRDQCDVTTFDG